MIACLGIYFSILVEKKKKELDIQTYKEIMAFWEGKSLTEIEKAREEGKRPYQTIVYTVGAGVIGAIVTLFFLWILGV